MQLPLVYGRLWTRGVLVSVHPPRSTVVTDLYWSTDLCWSFRVLASVQSPLGTIVTAIVSVVLEGGVLGLNASREGHLAAKGAVAQVCGEGYTPGFGPRYGRKLGANTLSLRDSWQPYVLPCGPV